jgi:hypothetical protein
MHADQKPSNQLMRAGVIAALLALSACASAPRGPASTLADAGIATTNAFAHDYQTTATHLRNVETSDAFTNTLAICSNPHLTCQPRISSDETHQARQDLARAVELRGRAVDALSGAYGALKTEAAYDARGDMVTATNSAIDAVNHFSGSVLAISGAATAPAGSLISEPLKSIVGFGAGQLADRAQARRLKNASHTIAGVTRRLRDSLSVEAFVFDTLAGHIEQARESAKESLLSAGLVSNDSIITPMINDLDLTPADGLEPTIRQSPAIEAAVRAVLQVQSRAEVAEVRERYAASIKALDQLLEAHADFERGQPLSLADLDRWLAELNAATRPAQ